MWREGEGREAILIRKTEVLYRRNAQNSCLQIPSIQREPALSGDQIPLQRMPNSLTNREGTAKGELLLHSQLKASGYIKNTSSCARAYFWNPCNIFPICRFRSPAMQCLCWKAGCRLPLSFRPELSRKPIGGHEAISCSFLPLNIKLDPLLYGMLSISAFY